MYDCYLIGVPYITSVYPNAALALLKGVAEQRGYNIKSRCIAWEISQKFKDDNQNISFCEPILNNLPYTFEQIRNSEVGKLLSTVVNEAAMCNRVALNCFSYYNTIGCLYILELLKLQKYKGRVLIGGKGLKTRIQHVEQFSNNAQTSDIAIDVFTRYNFVDICLGDGEEYFVDWLDGNTDSVIETKTAPLNYISNFDDFEDHSMLPITGSRGCVRKCTFCDIPGQFEKYRWADGGTVADRMLYYHKKYGTKKFYFTDSLVNGNMRAFNQFLDTIIDYKHKYDINFRWTGQYITRPIKQMPAEVYEKMTVSGAEGLATGIESGSNKILSDMKKLFTIEDVHFALEQFRKNNLSYVILLLPCYYTETWKDFLDTIEFVKHCQSYYADGTITSVSGGHPLRFDGSGITPMEKLAINDRVVINHENTKLWINANNPELNYKERTKRWLLLLETLQDQIYNNAFETTIGPTIKSHKEEMYQLLENDTINKFETEAIYLADLLGRGGYLNELRKLSSR